MHKQAEKTKVRLNDRPLYLLSMDPICEPCGGKVKGAKKVSVRVAYNFGFDTCCKCGYKYVV